MQDDSPSLTVRGLMQGDSLPLNNARLNALRLEALSNLNFFIGGGTGGQAKIL